MLGGRSIVKDDCILRGDLRRGGGGAASVVLSIGKWCILEKKAIVRPPWKVFRGYLLVSLTVCAFPLTHHASVLSYYPIRIGDYTYIGTEAIVEAAAVGNGCYIGARAIIVTLLPSIQAIRAEERRKGKRRGAQGPCCGAARCRRGTWSDAHIVRCLRGSTGQMDRGASGKCGGALSGLYQTNVYALPAVPRVIVI